MNSTSDSVRPRLFAIYVFLALVQTLNLNCRSQSPRAQSSPNPSPTLQQSSESVRISQIWEKERAKLNKNLKDYPAKQLDILKSLIEELPPDQLDNEFERIRSSQTSHEQMSDYDQNLLQLFVISAVRQRDRKKLVYLLSGQPPRFVATDAIELYLAHSGMPDPLLILFDSYEQSKNTRAQNDLIEILSNIFRSIRREHPDDREFVKASKDWYLNHKNKLKVNPLYHPSSDFSESRDFFVNTPL